MQDRPKMDEHLQELWDKGWKKFKESLDKEVGLGEGEIESLTSRYARQFRLAWLAESDRGVRLGTAALAVIVPLYLIIIGGFIGALGSLIRGDFGGMYVRFSDFVAALLVTVTFAFAWNWFQRYAGASLRMSAMREQALAIGLVESAPSEERHHSRCRCLGTEGETSATSTMSSTARLGANLKKLFRGRRRRQ